MLARIFHLNRRNRLIEAGIKWSATTVERLQSMTSEHVQELRAHQADALQQCLQTRVCVSRLKRPIEIIEDGEEIAEQLPGRQFDSLLEVTAEPAPQFLLLLADLCYMRFQQTILLL